MFCCGLYLALHPGAGQGPNLLLNATPIEKKDFESIRGSLEICDRAGTGLHQSMVQVPPKFAAKVESLPVDHAPGGFIWRDRGL